MLGLWILLKNSNKGMLKLAMLLKNFNKLLEK
jgi:hypothetical protein